MIKNLMHLRQHMEMDPLLFTVNDISCCVFYSNTIQRMLMYYVVTEMSCFDDYLDAAPRAKTMKRNGITSFLLHVSQCITFN